MGVSERLNTADVKELARIHYESLPDSAFSLLGRRALEAYYQQLIADPQDQVFIERFDGLIVGGCVLSYNSDTLAKRTVRHRPLTMVIAVASAFLSSGLMRRKLLGLMLTEVSPPKGVQGLPEVVQVFADRNYRCLKVGTRLLAKVETFMGGKTYFLKTEQSDNNAAIHFYRARGFQALGAVEEMGKRYLYLRKG